MARITKQTSKCVRCGKPAKGYAGYVLKAAEKVLAGWCSERCRTDVGFSGHWQRWMGKSNGK